MTGTEVVQGDLTWTGTQFEEEIQVVIDPDGRIADTGRLGLTPTKRLHQQALLPGLVNGHSHAFQRGLRGAGEQFPDGAGTFWTWREAMYGLVRELDEESFYDLSLQAFREMRAAGITTVGEFHYFHHSGDDQDFALDGAVLRAAAAANVRIVLLNAFYKTGGIGQPLDPTQRRFRVSSPEAYWERMSELAGMLDTRTQSLGVVVHSIRAAKLDDIMGLHDESIRRGLPFHMHVEEQRKEIDDAITSYGRPPMAVLNSTLSTMTNVTAVHCTHTAPKDMEQFIDNGGTVCVCPLTEGSLGDGIPALPAERRGKTRVTLGTDSNARICMTEEMRWLEFGQRVVNYTRGVYTDAAGSTARALLRIATENGARSLGVDAGAISPCKWADLVAIDLSAPSLRGCDETTLLETFVFGTGNEAIAGTCVGGKWED